MRSRVLAAVEAAVGEDGPATSVQFDGPVDSLVDAATTDDVLAVLREAISNATRHGQASKVTVRLTVGGGTLVLDVADDGTGLPDGVHRSGLANLADRARLRGGTFDACAPARGRDAAALVGPGRDLRPWGATGRAARLVACAG